MFCFRSVEMIRLPVVISFFVILCSILLTAVKSQHELYRFKPCHHGGFVMNYINRETRSWNGVLKLDILQRQHLQNIQVAIRLTTGAQISLIDNDGVVSTRNSTFHIRFSSRGYGVVKARFHVKGKETKMPNIISIHLNGENICENPQKFKIDNAELVIVTTTTAAPPRRTTPTHVPSYITQTTSTTTQRSTTSTPVLTTTAAISTTTAAFLDRSVLEIATAKCGKRLIYHQGLVTSGYPSQEGDWPWHAALYHRSTPSDMSYKCGGTLISPDSILTASHCIIEGGSFIVARRMVIRLGQHNRQLAGRNTQELQVYDVIPHPQFNFDDLKNDIAILKLSTRALFNNYVQPACLWPKDQTAIETVVNQNGFVVGWGLNEEDTLTDILTQGSMPVVSHLECLQSNRDFFGLFVSDTTFCAGFRNGTSVCNGDSGGGMFFKRDNVFFIRGVVSLSVSREDKDVCNPQQYVIFTDAAKYLSWIEANMH